MNTPLFDMKSAAGALNAVVAGVRDDQLELPTPSPEWTVAMLLAHIVGFTEAFRDAATKAGIGNSQPPSDADLVLEDGWRERIALQLEALVAAWREPEAWEGETEVGGVRGPATQMAVFALDEVVIHGWDLASATSQTYQPGDEDLAVLWEMLRHTPDAGTPGLFGPAVPTGAHSSLLDRVLGRTGRDPLWTAG
ncbi:TIGR03086 family metal-binding protein [Nocardia sp. NBC_01503]|uniref:TIGR03086 family metal-binding protein n=1 Tax=Nocardia sp. NBC_01503 TaxID=2975997 RepID=UPI002E7BDC18|nr:TIGR03086 family metal-binding protein [Nocardia sp. NBC_01503]WTL35863.1 TIGR03086 family metal-binding protein [Nocardia sp. NBC_01503]